MNLIKTIVAILIILINCFSTLAQRLVINEVMSANISTIADEDGDYSDWIELYNADSLPINLKGFGLSDNPSRPFKWIFPNVKVAAYHFVLIFASGKDIRTVPIHRETVIDWGDEWKYLVPQSEPASNWRAFDFDDAAWLSGPSGFGYDDNDDSTDVGSPDPFKPSPISVFIRKKITIEKVSDVCGAVLHVDYDDGFIAYLNGLEIARANLGVTGIIPTFNQFANKPQEARIYRGGEPEKFVIQNIQSVLKSGDNVMAMEVHNSELYSSDLTLIPFFTLEMTAAPAHPRGSSRHLQFPAAARMHTNFKIKATGETLLLSDATGKISDRIETGSIPADVSWGRQTDGSSNWFFFNMATPDTNNYTQGYQAVAPSPQFSAPGGFYINNLLLELFASSPGVSIRYTLDGSEPGDSSFLCTSLIPVDSTTVVRARCFGVNLVPSKTITQTYFINQQFTIPVISIVTDPKNLWDRKMGIYVFGDHADTVNYPYWGSNFWQDWERPIHIEFYEPDGSPGFGIDAGAQIFGSWSRLYPQKSLAIYARGSYGAEEINYQIFPDKPITKFQSLVLRNSGQDWGKTFFRDAMMQYLVKDLDLDIQAYRPAVVFLNGKIWGIHNIREKMSEHYLASNRGVDPTDIDFLERDTMIIKGDTDHYQELLNYMATHDMRLQSSYDYVKTQMDVENFINYTLSVIYFANSDWPWNNVKCWRPRTPDGRWKWLLYDLDYGFHGGHLGPEANVFTEMANQKNGTTFLFFKLVENEAYRKEFINYLADNLNTTFDPDRIIYVINQFKAGIAAEMPRHIARWHHTFVGPWWLGKSIDSMEEWYSHIQVLIDFTKKRADHVRQQLINEFHLWDGISPIHLKVLPTDGGRIKINSQIIENYPWSGKYFVNVPVQLTAISRSGYQFSGWIGAVPVDSASIQITIKDDQSLTAVFEPVANQAAPIVINEINYKSAATFNTEDWVEFYNNSHRIADISGWVFQDADDSNRYTFPARTIIEAGGYLVLCRDRLALLRFFPNARHSIGNLDFGLTDKGESLRLYDTSGNPVDSLTYAGNVPWPVEANGKGFTLELQSPTLDNSLPQSWAAAKQVGGTPGSPNSVLTSLYNIVPQQPVSFELFQNYPNPFNSQTYIKFALPRTESVVLKIFNVRGEEIKTLISRRLAAGIYQVTWEGTDKFGNEQSSGMYFYCLKTSSFRQVHKMILIQ